VQHLQQIEGLIQDEVGACLKHICNAGAIAHHSKHHWPMLPQDTSARLGDLRGLRQIEIHNERRMVLSG
jgi:hypothetical protein